MINIKMGVQNRKIHDRFQLHVILFISTTLATSLGRYDVDRMEYEAQKQHIHIFSISPCNKGIAFELKYKPKGMK